MNRCYDKLIEKIRDRRNANIARGFENRRARFGIAQCLFGVLA